MITTEQRYCERCGRPLSNHERAADGMGLVCRRRMPHPRRLRLVDCQPDGTRTFTLWSLTSRGPEADRYTVRINFEDGTFSCSCPDFRFRGSTCKHIRRACDYEARNRERMVA